MEKKTLLIINSIILSIIILIMVGVLVSEAVYEHRVRNHYINETNISIQFDDNSKKFDPAKPTLLLIHTQRCGLCVRFLPIFNKASKKYKDKYNFVALEGNDPRNYTLVQDNVTELPMVYIYDTSIGNKIHIPSTMLGDEEHFFFELDRYLHFRSLLNLEQAVKDHQEAIAKTQKK